MRLSSKEDCQKYLDRKITKTAYKKKKTIRCLFCPGLKMRLFLKTNIYKKYMVK